MTAQAIWRPLPTFPDLPALLVRPAFDVETSSYILQVTDLAHIWTESLDRKSILKRSLNEDTSIDLSDGDREQWRVFLSKLEAAFDPASPDHEHTSLTLSPHRGAGNGSDGGDLVLHITCVLPKPLEPLKWPVYLARRQPNALASELVVPLVQAARARAQEAEYLVARLKEKDAIIDRVLDKLQAVCTGLENVFHSLPIKRKATRAAAEEKVPGLAPFNEGGWRAQCAASEKRHDDVSALVQDAFGDGTFGRYGNDVKVPEDVNGWWANFKPSRAVIKPIGQPPTVVSSTPEKANRSGDSDDDFQVQATPSSARKNRDREQRTTRRDGYTTDEEHSETQIPDSLPKKADEEPPAPRPRLGVLGGRKVTAAAASRQTHSQSQSSRTIPKDDDETASDSEDDHAAVKKPAAKAVGTIGGKRQKSSSPPTLPAAAKSPSPAPTPLQPKDDDETASEPDSDVSPKPQSAVPAQKKRGGLGQIGGRSRATPTPAPADSGDAADPPGPTADSTSANDTNVAAKRPRRGLGVIGKHTGGGGGEKRTEVTSELHADSSAEGSEGEKRDRKAERKRTEAAKEPEKKVAAPVKKKRRF